MEDERVGVRIVRVVTAEFLAKKAFDLNCLTVKTVSCKNVFDVVHAEKIPVIFVCRPDHMIGNFVHLKEVCANRAACDATKFFHGDLETLNRKMFEEIVNERELERVILCIDFKNISFFKTSLWEKGAGIFDVFGAENRAAV